MIFGASGDLTARKLLPALGQLAADGALALEVTLVGGAHRADRRRVRSRRAGVMRLTSEGLSIRSGAKVPGRSFDIRKASMDFAYAEGFPHGSADAYERVIFDPLLGDPTLFIRADEVGRSWRIVDPSSNTGPPPPTRFRCTRRAWGPARRTTSSPPTDGAGGTSEVDAALDAVPIEGRSLTSWPRHVCGHG
ncbi:MAG TPA: hypothetical protein VIV12_00395 [Streptosporangiaceae bacterium]